MNVSAMPLQILPPQEKIFYIMKNLESVMG